MHDASIHAFYDIFILFVAFDQVEKKKIRYLINDLENGIHCGAKLSCRF